jgi:hypothetical protein
VAIFKVKQIYSWELLKSDIAIQKYRILIFKSDCENRLLVWLRSKLAVRVIILMILLRERRSKVKRL